MTNAVGRYLSFDPVAEEYDQTRVIPPSALDDIARLCLSAANVKNADRFLDAGVGTGRFGAALDRITPGQIVGIDISRAMMARARAKNKNLTLIHGDLQRLPFPKGVFRGALVVHILHLIENWKQVVTELRRTLMPGTGTLLLGSEQGGRSPIVDFYYARARARGVLSPSLGVQERAKILTYVTGRAGGGARVEQLSAPYLAWKRVVPISHTLDALERRTYSQMWRIPDSEHSLLMAETRAQARRISDDVGATETLAARFVLHSVRWPG